MSNTHDSHLPHLLRCATAGFLVAGILLLVTSSSDLVMATVIGPGSTVIHPLTVEASASLRATGLHMPISMDGRADAELRLIIGMLMVLAGFGFHALGLVRAAEMPVPIRRRGRGRMGRLLDSLHRAFRTRLV